MNNSCNKKKKKIEWYKFLRRAIDNTNQEQPEKQREKQFPQIINIYMVPNRKLKDWLLYSEFEIIHSEYL